MSTFLLGFILGGLFGAGTMALMQAKKDDDIQQDIIPTKEQNADAPRGSCESCVKRDDEMSGECAECLQGLFDHYERRDD